MNLWEVSLRAQYDYPFIDLSKEFPDTEITMWCVWNRELVRVPTDDPGVLPGIAKAIRRAGRVVDWWVDGDGGRVFLLRCTCGRYTSPWNIVSESECFDAPPLVFRGGWGYLRALSLEAKRTRALLGGFQRRGSAELLAKRELPMSALPTTVWVHGLFAGLTPRQVEALLMADRMGYYRSPRLVTTGEVAARQKVSRSAYEEHLRNAENRIVASLIPYLQLYATATKPPDRLPLRTTLSERKGEN
jgi:predicted DNA binding protein